MKSTDSSTTSMPWRAMISPRRRRAELGGTDLGPQVADVVGQAVVHLQRVEHVAALDAPVDDLHDRPAHAFAPHVGGGDVVPTGHRAAGVAVVALDRRDQHHATRARGRVVGEHGAKTL